MTYTAEQLREEALSIEREGRDADEVDSKWLIGLLRAHADALEENARLKAEIDEIHATGGTSYSRLQRAEAELADHSRWLDEMVADYRLMADPHTESKRLAINALIHDQRAEIAKLRANRDFWMESCKQAQQHRDGANEQLTIVEAELAETRRDLQFIERWANHHGQKPNITPREVLSMIQHYPPILEITRSYEDGKVPNTPNPWAELAKLRQHAEAMADDLDRFAAQPDYDGSLYGPMPSLIAYRADFPEM